MGVNIQHGSGGGGGSGAVNSGILSEIAFYPSSGTTIDGASNLKFDNTAKSLSIGTASPATAGLNVTPFNSAGYVGIAVFDKSGSGGVGTISSETDGFKIGSSQTMKVYATGDYSASQIWEWISNQIKSLVNLVVSVNSTASFVVTNGSTNRFIIDATNGYVGFGNIAPSQMVDINDDTIRLRNSKTPSSAGASGSAGQIAWDTNYLYVCTATNTWKRAALSSW